MIRTVRPEVPVEERMAIEELSALYSFYCDMRLYEEMADLFCEDGIFDETAVGADRVSRGPAEVAAQMIEFRERLGPCIHICSNHLISSFDKSSAKGTCHLLSEGTFNIGGESQVFRIMGYYDDKYQKDAGQWLFKSRVLKLLIPYP